jgi:porin
MLGKINTVDLLRGDPFFGGAGTSRFMNLAFAAPPTGLTPAVIMGGLLSVRTAPLTWTVMAYDPNDRTNDYGPEDLFHNGVNVSLAVKYAGQLAGRTSSLTLTGIYSTKEGADLGQLLLPPELQTGNKHGSYYVSLQGVHFLHKRAGHPGQGWGLFVKIGFSDGNPNPYQAFLSGGIGGKGLVAFRPDDSFGLGYFYYNFSDDLQSAVDPFAVFDDEQGIELFYTVAVTPWLHLSLDLQYVHPATGANANALVGGLRLRLRL